MSEQNMDPKKEILLSVCCRGSCRHSGYYCSYFYYRCIKQDWHRQQFCQYCFLF